MEIVKEQSGKVAVRGQWMVEPALPGQAIRVTLYVQARDAATGTWNVVSEVKLTLYGANWLDATRNQIELTCREILKQWSKPPIHRATDLPPGLKLQ